MKTQVVGGISFGAITTPAHYSIFLAEKLIGSGGACKYIFNVSSININFFY